MGKKDNEFIHGEAFKWGIMMNNNTAMSIAVRTGDDSIIEKVKKQS